MLSTDDKKQKVPRTTPKFQVILYLGTLPSTIVWETASQIGLRNYSRVYGGASMYRSFCWKQTKNVVKHEKITANHRKTHLTWMILVLFYVREEARVQAHWNYFLDMHLTYLGSVFSFSPPEVPSGFKGGRWLQWLMAW